MVTTFGMCPGVKSGENEQEALERQIAYYGRYRAHRLFFPALFMDTGQSAYHILDDGDIDPDEDVWVSCKETGTTSDFRARVQVFKAIRAQATGKTLFTLKHEPEGDLTVAAYNQAWDTIAPVLEEEQDWLLPGPILTAFRSRRVDADGVRLYNWREWIPSTPATRALLKFVGCDLYPGAGRPTKAKPNYYEPPSAHQSPYGNWEEIGFAGILDEMCEELGLPGAIGEFNHERPSTANGWPSTFTDPQGEGNVAFIDALVQHSKAMGYLMVCQFHKGGGILTDRTPQAEANFYAQVLEDNWNDVDEPDPTEPDPDHPQYLLGYTAGQESRQAEIDEMNLYIEDLESNQLPQAKKDGRNEAFAETRDWVANQIV